MSYCRFGPDSDVYVYWGEGGYVCCGCKLNSPRIVFRDAESIIFHLRDHKFMGHKVPEYAIDTIIGEKAEEKIATEDTWENPYKELCIIDGCLYGRDNPDQNWSELSAGEASRAYRTLHKEHAEIKRLLEQAITDLAPNANRDFTGTQYSRWWIKVKEMLATPERLR